MSRYFIANDGFKKDFSRSLAKGHKSVHIDSSVVNASPITMKTDGTTLLVTKDTEVNENKQESYTFLCKEFGLANYNDTPAKISVIFCDNGWMFVTLLYGAIILNINDELMMPTIGDIKSSKVVTEDIVWIDEEYMLSMTNYFKDEEKVQFKYDFEYVFEATGQILNGCHHSNIKYIAEETKDISLGYVAQYIQNKNAKKQSQALKTSIADMINCASSSYEFEDDDEYDSEVDIEYDEDDEDDYDVY